ncbi:cilia- and flagella-associated protein 20-like [Solea solea]|uniref:cilia- and flagella-associated protein 20-like n=1 Tax=Solea solea TaxID=90069 RepID=UPI00272CEDEF|nr:cilia- and flagella-associated protein 20-like [Solea solea]
MFEDSFQSGSLSILYSVGNKPLQGWDTKVKIGHIKRITDEDIDSSVLELAGTNINTTFITCPADPHMTLGIRLPFMVMIIKNLKKHFSFEVLAADDKNVCRRFRASTYVSTTKLNPYNCTMPLRLTDGWNYIQFNLADFIEKLYGTQYVETQRVQINGNCRIRRVYFSDKFDAEEDFPEDFENDLPIHNQQVKQQLAPLPQKEEECGGAMVVTQHEKGS